MPSFCAYMYTLVMYCCIACVHVHIYIYIYIYIYMCVCVCVCVSVYVYALSIMEVSIHYPAIYNNLQIRCILFISIIFVA